MFCVSDRSDVRKIPCSAWLDRCNVHKMPCSAWLGSSPIRKITCSACFFLSTAHRRHMAKQAQASTKPHGPKDCAGATGLNFAQSSAGSPESSQLSEPAWWLHAHFGRRPFPWKQFIQAVSAGGQATRPCQSIPRKVGANATQWSLRVATPSGR